MLFPTTHIETGSAADTFLNLEYVKQARTALGSTGGLLIEGAYTRDTCEELVRWMDASATGPAVEANYSGSEHRIWDAHNRHPLLRSFWAQCNFFLSCLCRQDIEAFTLLAIRNRTIDKKDEALQVGRWHIDSFRRQYKIFLFLSDVTEASGPFEFIPGTQKMRFKLSMAAQGMYFRAGDMVSGTRGYSKLKEPLIEKVLMEKPGLPAICNAGTIMVVDTSAIHRARPCFEGTRYALTAYYR